MNLKGMETSIQYHLIFKLLQAFTLIFFVTLISCKAESKVGNFKRLTKSKCLKDKNEITEKAASRTQCSILCLSHVNCGYFSYCNGVCHMHQPFYYQKLEDYDCDCSLYILLKENGNKWQKVYKMTRNSFERSPIYLYWENLPIEKVEFRVRRYNGDLVYLFNGRGTNPTSFYRNDNFLSININNSVKRKFTSNNNTTEPHYHMDYGDDSNFGNWIDAKMVNGKYELQMYHNGVTSIDYLIISVLFN